MKEKEIKEIILKTLRAVNELRLGNDGITGKIQKRINLAETGLTVLEFDKLIETINKPFERYQYSFMISEGLTVSIILE